MSKLHYVYQQNFYHYEQDKMDDIFDEYHPILLKNIDHPPLIQERKQNLDVVASEKK